MVSFTPRPLYPHGNTPGTHWIGGWVGPRAVLDAVGTFLWPLHFQNNIWKIPRRSSRKPRTCIVRWIRRKKRKNSVTMMTVAWSRESSHRSVSWLVYGRETPKKTFDLMGAASGTRHDDYTCRLTRWLQCNQYQYHHTLQPWRWR
jgi:hypothetical protein